ncbi:hypothetical protein [Runella sp.]|uniref:hypothetical protein n=1 Tax=Runella sp. TaxID=1960881 RepID=UPI003D0B25E6
MFSKYFLMGVAVLFAVLGCKKTPQDEYKRIKTTVLKIQKKVENGNLSRQKTKDYLKQLDKLEEAVDELEVEAEATMMDMGKEKALLQKGFNYLMLEDVRLKIKNLRQQLDDR